LPAFLEIAKVYIAAARKRIVDKANRPTVREVITIIAPTGCEQVLWTMYRFAFISDPLYKTAVTPATRSPCCHHDVRPARLSIG